MAAVGLRFELFVDDIEATARFFEAVLGFEVLGVVVPGATPSDDYVALRSGPVTIGLGLYANLPEGHAARREPRGGGVEIVIEVDDVDDAYARARQRAPQIEALTDRPWGLRDFRVVAPDGFYVRVTNTAG